MTCARLPRAQPMRRLFEPTRRRDGASLSQDHLFSLRVQLFRIVLKPCRPLQRQGGGLSAPDGGRANAHTPPSHPRSCPIETWTQKWPFRSSRRLARLVIWCRARCAHAPRAHIIRWRLSAPCFEGNIACMRRLWLLLSAVDGQSRTARQSRGVESDYTKLDWVQNCASPVLYYHPRSTSYDFPRARCTGTMRTSKTSVYGSCKHLAASQLPPVKGHGYG